jgi:hypothetical protein
MIEKRTKIEGSIDTCEELRFEPDGDCGTIEVTGDVIAKTISIESGGSIKADGSIESGGFIFSFKFEIGCKALKTKLLPFWREYWAAMPPLSKFADEIRNQQKCWEDIREALAHEAVEICEWDGWHPLLKAQLEMFFGLKQEVLFEQ